MELFEDALERIRLRYLLAGGPGLAFGTGDIDMLFFLRRVEDHEPRSPPSLTITTSPFAPKNPPRPLQAINLVCRTMDLYRSFSPRDCNLRVCLDRF